MRRALALLLTLLLMPSAPPSTVLVAGWSAETSNPGNAVGTGRLRLPGTLASLHADTANDGSVRLRWTPGLGTVAPSEYVVQRASGGSYAEVARVSPADAGCGDGTCEHADTTAAYNATYTYRVFSSVASWTAGPTNVTTAASLPPVRGVARSAGTTYTLHDVDDSSAAGVVAVGEGGRILACASSCGDTTAQWLPAVSPTTSDLYDVHVESASKAWAAGAGGTLLTCTASCTSSLATWTRVTTLPGTPGALHGAWSDGAYAVVVGAAGYVARLKDGTWALAAKSVDFPATATVRGVAGRSSKQVVVVGDGGLIAVCNITGNNACGDSGSAFTKRTVVATTTFHGVATVANNTYAVVGAGGAVYVNADNSVALFAKVVSTGTGTSDLYDVAVLGNAVRAVGAGGAVTTCTSGCTVAATSAWTASSAGTTSSLRGIAGGNGLWWAVGDNATIRRDNGTAWAAQSTPGAASAETPVDGTTLERKDGTSSAAVTGTTTGTPTSCGTPALVAYLSPPAAVATSTRVTVTVSYTASGGGTLLVSPDNGGSWVSRSLPSGTQDAAYDLTSSVPTLSTGSERLHVCLVPSSGSVLTADLVHVDVDAAT